ncbi:double-stranded RNA-binding domain-containing protein [Fadolivirus algeromassiliense]|jgi:hypothetical protein|uniref:Double-stranded RNA-binding domain-containing protein n=1 Tax=Fadolivirus FV1/VV64 TaxID=3070911 RepID=A0A7D3UVN5_9VIRU|nr:double-stranded RNA-binding domain-containing protein [Fadolivirus algeromassiliense]QKF94329.1 double-stranded RNA-binding domain-containing protein [Fadolivirus FV1/VV64]
MDKSSKNLLQEYCQRNGLKLPMYSDPTRIDKNKDNDPTWQSVVSLFDGCSFYGIDNTKRGAELIAAKDAYEYILNKYKQQEIKISYKQKVSSIYEIPYKIFNKILFIDGENCDFDIEKLDTDTLLLIFVAKNTTRKKVFEYQEKYDNCYVFISESVGRDAADHFLTFTAGKLSALSIYEKQFYVLTKDHYGEYLEKFMNNCKFICSIDEIK